MQALYAHAEAVHVVTYTPTPMGPQSIHQALLRRLATGRL